MSEETTGNGSGRGPASEYEQAIQSGLIKADAEQAAAVAALNKIYLGSTSSPGKQSWFRRRTEVATRGLYMHGGVGRGKTYLMDLLASSLPPETTLRAHFHHFMADTHQAIKAHAQQADPLVPIAEELGQRIRVLCFDEFFVSDVADAMILGRLMTRLFEQGLTLVATSNIAPQDLYANGLQRDRFLPAIAALEQHCEVLCVDGGTDYRLRELQRALTYHQPLNERSAAALTRSFDTLAHGQPQREGSITLLGRAFHCQAQTPDIIWFSFADLCEGPRAAADYIEIAREYGTVILSDIPQMDYQLENEARRFLHLVDEFYDRRVKLLMSAAVPLNQLYSGKRLAFEFARAMSRLEEMQTEDYLAQPHRPI